MSLMYLYRIERGAASLSKVENGDDVGGIKKIGQFKTDVEAKQACEKHYEKACKGMVNLGIEAPQKFYV